MRHPPRATPRCPLPWQGNKTLPTSSAIKGPRLPPICPETNLRAPQTLVLPPPPAQRIVSDQHRPGIQVRQLAFVIPSIVVERVPGGVAVRIVRWRAAANRSVAVRRTRVQRHEARTAVPAHHRLTDVPKGIVAQPL